jgi:hypothetical protein
LGTLFELVRKFVVDVIWRVRHGGWEKRAGMGIVEGGDGL